MIRDHWHVWLIALFLCALGIGFTLYQIYVKEIPLNPDEIQEIWVVDTHITFDGRPGRPAKITLNLPEFDGPFLNINERFISNNYGTMMHEEDGLRQVIWSTRRPVGQQSLYYRSTIRRSNEEKITKGETYTNKSPFDSQVEKLAAKALVEPIRNRSADIETFVSETVKLLAEKDNNNAQLLLKGDNSQDNKALIASKLLSLVHIPVEIVHALPLTNGTNISPSTWIRSFNGKKWLYFNPVTGVEGMPAHFLPWWTGNKPVASVIGGKNIKISFSVSKHVVDKLNLVFMEDESLYSKFSLYNLPVQTQHVYQILLTIPVGVLVILFLRTFVGIITFGTFTPVLISLAFRETQLLWGIILFTLVTGIGLLLRTYLEHLRLLLLPRLGVVLSFVVLTMLGISLLSHALGLERGLNVALFPMVILTMTIERMAVLWEERGPGEATIAALGSLFAASLAYLCMLTPTIIYLMFTFPGLVVVLMGIMIALGRYSGYKLSEIYRFKTFWRPSE